MFVCACLYTQSKYLMLTMHQQKEELSRIGAFLPTFEANLHSSQVLYYILAYIYVYNCMYVCLVLLILFYYYCIKTLYLYVQIYVCFCEYIGGYRFSYKSNNNYWISSWNYERYVNMHLYSYVHIYTLYYYFSNVLIYVLRYNINAYLFMNNLI